MPYWEKLWKDRNVLVRGPEAEFIEPVEFAKLFGLDDESYEELYDEGILPRVIKMGRRKLHTWDHVVYFSLWIRLICHHYRLSQMVEDGKLGQCQILKEADDGTPKTKVYFVECGNYIKIGVAQCVQSRMRALQTSNPQTLGLLLAITGGYEDEAKLHSKFEKFRVRTNGEWFHDCEEIRAFIAEKSAAVQK